MTSSSQRVHELARRLGVSSREVLGRLAELSPDAPTHPSSKVPPSLAQALLATVKGGAVTSEEAGPAPDASSQALRLEGASLLRAAFERARASKRQDWRRMTLAVLKNRVLDHTDRSFDEARWGAGSFREFVGMFPEVVSVDSSTRPPTAELIEGPAREGPARPDAEAPVPAPGAAVLTPERRGAQHLTVALGWSDPS